MGWSANEFRCSQMYSSAHRMRLVMNSMAEQSCSCKSVFFPAETSSQSRICRKVYALGIAYTLRDRCVWRRNVLVHMFVSSKFDHVQHMLRAWRTNLLLFRIGGN